jgi:hypothetical protein
LRIVGCRSGAKSAATSAGGLRRARGRGAPGAWGGEGGGGAGEGGEGGGGGNAEAPLPATDHRG